MSAPRVVVTGLGMVTPMGVGHRAFWDGVLAARSTAAPIKSFDAARCETRFACEVDDAAFDVARYVPNRKALKLMSRSTGFAVAAAHLALADAGLERGMIDPLRAGVAVGAGGVGFHDVEHLDTLRQVAAEQGATCGSMLELALRHMNPLTPLKTLPNITATHISINNDLRGENVTVCTACTSSTQAIGEALRIIRAGHADVMVAGGSDAMINLSGVVGFAMLGVLSTRNADPARAARPFDRDRDGFVMGEGGVMLVLESEAHATRRGAPILAELAGYGNAADAYRITDEPEDGRGSAEAMRRALADARTAPAEVHYVNAHGTGTVMNDKTEVRALRTVFGAALDHTAVSSTKSQVGHLVAGAGAVETAACVLALRHQVLPPTINLEEQDPACDIDAVANTPRPARIDAVLKNSFGFGGQNACLVLRRWAR